MGQVQYSQAACQVQGSAFWRISHSNIPKMVLEAVSGDIIQLPDASEYLYSRIRYYQCGLRMTLTYAPMGSRAEMIIYVESNS